MLKTRFALFTIMWLFLCAAQPPAQKVASPTAQAESNASISAFSPPRGYSTDPCYKAEDQNVAAFCAQWKSADAAQSSAEATWWTVYLAGTSIALAFITMAAAIAAAYFAKKAADETKRGADAAHAANRPWLDIDLKLHGVYVNYDAKGYLLQLEVTPLNAGTSPATDVREQVECVFYDHFSKNDDDHPFGSNARDQALRESASAVSFKLREERETGPTVFPERSEPFYIETVVPWDWNDGYPSPVAWLTAGLRYSFPDGTGETIKVFCVRSFGFPEMSDFESMGAAPFATVKIDPVVAVWPRFGYVK
ncbi:hypothetical protein [Sphingobium yanoikuyae]|uniref:hypothetical protein n=1 Tax=Sphingobium yanoikuyae TaxID=13690 RepID=UPI0028A971ED|nr:hypothetical protein [Sphingobium yanoikuyae]